MKNNAILEFEKYKLSEFNQWYTPQLVEYLTHLNQQGDFLRYVFFDRNPGDIQSQFESLNTLKNIYTQSAKVKSISFISKEPGLGENHFIFGLLIQNKIIVINPVGETDHTNFYEALGKFKEYSKADIFLSHLVLQKDIKVGSGLVSCGPICIELMRHISLLPAAEIIELTTKGAKCNKDGLEYTKIDIQQILPDTLSKLINIEAADYKNKILEIRALHKNVLSEHPSLKNLTTSQQNEFLENKCANHPMQEVIRKHLQDGGMHKTEIINEYLIIEEYLQLQEDTMKSIAKKHTNNKPSKEYDLKPQTFNTEEKAIPKKALNQKFGYFPTKGDKVARRDSYNPVSILYPVVLICPISGIFTNFSKITGIYIFQHYSK